MARVVGTAPIHDIGQRRNGLAGGATHTDQAAAIDRVVVDLPLIQIGDGLGGCLIQDAIDHSTARTTPVQAHDEARSLCRSPMVSGRDAKPPVVAVDQPRSLLQMREAWAPHEGAVPENQSGVGGVTCLIGGGHLVFSPVFRGSNVGTLDAETTGPMETGSSPHPISEDTDRSIRKPGRKRRLVRVLVIGTVLMLAAAWTLAWQFIALSTEARLTAWKDGRRAAEKHSATRG